MRILVVNAGSSSLKLSVLDGAETDAEEGIPVPGGDIDMAGLRRFVDSVGHVDAVGHRIVHGGTDFSAPVEIDSSVRARLAALSDLAPLHQARSLAAYDAVTSLRPDVVAVACFDTAFHSTIPDEAATYALPAEWRQRWPLRRFGFHGLSHAYASKRAAEMIGAEPARARVVTCHLGAGASVAAVDRGRSVDTTMGFTPLEGLVMATRSGSVDPGLILWMIDRAGMSAPELADQLEHRSGILGLSGQADLGAVIRAEADGHDASRLAIGVYLHRLRAAIASMTAAMGGLDVLVFTGGVGEKASAIRQRCADGLGFIGVSIDRSRNDGAIPDAHIETSNASVACLVIRAREDIQIAGEVEALLDPG